MTTTTKSTAQQTRQAMRNKIRKARLQLSTKAQHHAKHALVAQLLQLPEFIKAQKIALYIANDGELNTDAVIQWCWQQHKEVYLPVLHPFSAGHLLFLRYTPETPMQHNQFNIVEPKLNVATLCPITQLDLLLMPLVAFDNKGNRLGMGGGFYDRSLANCYATQCEKPVFIGIAHDCQQVAEVPSDYWDIPLAKIVTPTKIIQPK
jgi:5-formyltetrahydrofolate cyclo-ligase